MTVSEELSDSVCCGGDSWFNSCKAAEGGEEDAAAAAANASKGEPVAGAGVIDEDLGLVLLIRPGMLAPLPTRTGEGKSGSEVRCGRGKSSCGSGGGSTGGSSIY